MPERPHLLAGVTDCPIVSLGNYGVPSRCPFCWPWAQLPIHERKPSDRSIIPMLTLYQFESCPFCWKVKSVLHYHGIPYRAVEVNPMNQKELEPLGMKKVPVLVDGDKVMAESSDIIDHLAAQYVTQAGGETGAGDVPQWRGWVDDTLVHYLPPIIHGSFVTSWRTFGEVLKPSGYGFAKRQFVRMAGAVVMSRVAQKKARSRGIDDPAAGLRSAVDHWVSSGLADRPFHGGDAPDLADLAVFGVFRSTDGLAAVEMARSHNPDFADWYDRIKPLTQPKS